jgi:hypothetical protein
VDVVRIGPRKQRTRQHVIADQSVNFIERFIIDAGHTAQRVEKDYGYDLLLFTYDVRGYVEPGVAFIQLKALETLEQTGSDYVFDLDIRDYNLWMMNRMPVFLVLFEASRRRAFWLHVQGSFPAGSAHRPKPRAKTIRVRVPVRQSLNRRAIASMQRLKQVALERGRREAEA